jgi:hypothetical protein
MSGLLLHLEKPVVLASMVAGGGSVGAVEQEIVDANQLQSTDDLAAEKGSFTWSSKVVIFFFLEVLPW